MYYSVIACRVSISGMHLTLIYSSIKPISDFRNHTCFFSSPFDFNGQKITAQSIRDSLGNFDKVIKCPARYGARMSQAFSPTDPSIVLHKSVIKYIPDLKTRQTNQEFSDGCGTISRELAEETWEGMLGQLPDTRRRLRHKNEPTPCAFQIRIGGQYPTLLYQKLSSSMSSLF
jgi:RNA-dependent RNA polymerase